MFSISLPTCQGYSLPNELRRVHSAEVIRPDCHFSIEKANRKRHVEGCAEAFASIKDEFREMGPISSKDTASEYEKASKKNRLNYWAKRIFSPSQQKAREAAFTSSIGRQAEGENSESENIKDLKPIGFASIRDTNDLFYGKCININTVGVTEPARRKGVAKALIQRIISDSSKSHPTTPLQLSVTAESMKDLETRAPFKLYSQAGFKMIDEMFLDDDSDAELFDDSDSL